MYFVINFVATFCLTRVTWHYHVLCYKFCSDIWSHWVMWHFHVLSYKFCSDVWSHWVMWHFQTWAHFRRLLIGGWQGKLSDCLDAWIVLTSPSKSTSVLISCHVCLFTPSWYSCSIPSLVPWSHIIPSYHLHECRGLKILLALCWNNGGCGYYYCKLEAPALLTLSRTWCTFGVYVLFGYFGNLSVPLSSLRIFGILLDEALLFYFLIRVEMSLWHVSELWVSITPTSYLFSVLSLAGTEARQFGWLWRFYLYLCRVLHKTGKNRFQAEGNGLLQEENSLWYLLHEYPAIRKCKYIVFVCVLVCKCYRCYSS